MIAIDKVFKTFLADNLYYTGVSVRHKVKHAGVSEAYGFDFLRKNSTKPKAITKRFIDFFFFFTYGRCVNF